MVSTNPITDLHKVTLDWITPDPERVLARHARVSTENPDRPEFIKLLNYCIKQGHVSVFEQVCASYEIITTRSISAQILRHKSFCFQETSQRYCDPNKILSGLTGDPAYFELRAQDTKNRQNSVPYDDSDIEERYRGKIRMVWSLAQTLYDNMVDDGVAKECARNLLPMGTPTRLHMQGTLRNWLFYVGVRAAPGTQKEHKYIACSIGQDLRCQLPDVISSVIQAAVEDSSLGLTGWKYIDEFNQ
jgi:thymidylate synthase (FAD)